VPDLTTLRVAATAAPLRQRVADNIRSAIIEGKFKPGERLKESELCEWTGVSRSAVREALRQLEAEGVVANIPNRGPAVAQVTPDEARAHYEVRAALEALAVRAAAQRITDPQVKILKAFKKDLKTAAQAGSIKDMLVVKNQLDDLIMELSGNTLLKSFLDVIHARLSYLRPIVMAQPERLRENLIETSELIDAIVARDADRAAAAVLLHVTKGASATLAILGRQLDEAKQANG
jgi:DNA-binding GntR family transcriptional regulator